MPDTAPAPLSRRSAGLAGAFVAALAGLLASAPARNPDAWAHLVAGRDALRGALAPGWLADLAAFAAFQTSGGAGLVALKALAVVATALVVLGLARAGGAGWPLATAATALAALAVGVRVPLHPVTGAYLLFAVAVAVAWRRPVGPAAWPLALVVLAWANADPWVVVGLGAVALVWVGRVLDGTAAAGRVAVAVAVLLVVATANPAHVRALAPPAELTTEQGVTSPFRPAYYDGVGRSVAGWAYFPLLGLGLASFALNRAGWRWDRFLPWAGLAVLSVVNARAVPFFAVVGGPVLAWNVAGWAAIRTGRAWRTAVVVGRGAGVVAAVAVLGAAWPGWVQAPLWPTARESEPRRWALELPAGLAAAAEAHRGSGGRALHLSPESAAAFAWACPDDAGVYDAALAAPFLDAKPPPLDWVARMRALGIDRVVVYDPDRARVLTALTQLLADPHQRPLVRVTGGVAVFGWRDPEAADRFAGAALDLDALAFRPTDNRTAPRPARDPRPRHWTDGFVQPFPTRTADRDEAALWLLLAEAGRLGALVGHLQSWEATQVAGLAAAAAAWGGPGLAADAAVRLTAFRPPLAPGGRTAPLTADLLSAQQRFRFARDDVPPAPLYLGVRAARRAIAADPDDATAYLVLGECYLRLLGETRERAWARQCPELLALRRAQASWALNTAARLNPESAAAHLDLGTLYVEMRYFDLALRHRREHARLSPPAGREQADRELQALADTVAEQEKSLASAGVPARAGARAAAAFDRGLAGAALDALLASDVAAFGADGLELELDLLLGAGRAADVRDWTSPEQADAIGAGKYFWVRGRALAATGDYEAARGELQLLASGGRDAGLATLTTAVAQTAGQLLLDIRPLGFGPGDLVLRAHGRYEYLVRLSQYARGMEQGADALTLAGLVALEEGNPAEARAAFRAARGLKASSRGGVAFNARAAAEDGLRWVGE